MSKTTTLNPPLKLSLRTARILSLLVLGGIAIGYLGGAIFAAPDGDTPIGFVGLRLIGLFSAVALFIELGHHSSHLAHLREAYGKRRQRLDEALRQYLPWAHRTPSSGGTAVWLRGPPGLDTRRLAEDCAVEGVLIEPGDVFFSGEDAPRNYFRLGFASIAADLIEPGIARLARAAEKQFRHVS